MKDPLLERYIQIINENDNESTMIIDKNGWKRWRNKQRRLHRTDGPAVISPKGFKYYYINGKRHREDGPAVITPDGYQAYYIENKLHRTDGPAVISPIGYQAYYIDNKLHRNDGPAKIEFDGSVGYYINNKQVFKGNGTEPSKKVVVSKDRTIYLDPYNQLHRLDGPALELDWGEGMKFYYINGKYYPTKDKFYAQLVKNAINVGNKK